ncbi:hypothetical protein ABW20_dc0104714 [Dactylellina cionopaga]|nr:hypothetical protein ABW20_dc0104714 [Dactylellina cionopaga]
MQISTTIIGIIVIAIVFFLALIIGILSFILQKRQNDEKARVMITMAGTTVVQNNGAREIVEATWVPGFVGPGNAAAFERGIDRRASMYSYTSSGSTARDLESGQLSDIERSASPRSALKRFSYMSAKKLEIPDVLTEDDEERTGSEKGVSDSDSSGDTSVATAGEKPPIIYIENVEASQSGSSGFEDDIDIQKILRNEKDISVPPAARGKDVTVEI